HAAKTEVIAATADFALAARAHHVARAILVCAKKRATAQNTFLLSGLRRIERRIRPPRITRHAAGLGELRVIIRPIPIAAPFPNVTGHIEQAVAICRKLRDRRDARKPVLAGILNWKLSLKNIRHPFAAWFQFVAP